MISMYTLIGLLSLTMISSNPYGLIIILSVISFLLYNTLNAIIELSKTENSYTEFKKKLQDMKLISFIKTYSIKKD